MPLLKIYDFEDFVESVAIATLRSVLRICRLTLDATVC